MRSPLRLLSLLAGLAAVGAFLTAAPPPAGAHRAGAWAFLQETDGLRPGLGGPLPDTTQRRGAPPDTTRRDSTPSPEGPGLPPAPVGSAAAPDTTRRDTTRADSTAALPPDSLAADSLGLAADTAATDTLAERYFPLVPADDPRAPLVERRPRPFLGRPGPYWRYEVELDSTELRYRATERVGEQDVRVPQEADFATFREARLRHTLATTFRDLADQRLRRTRAGRGGLGITIDLPGGNETAFATIFGRNEVDLRVNGQANIDLGVNYVRNELQQAATGRGGQLNPDFGQELTLGITGTIGDKLRVNVNYDTQNTFEFQNQVSLVYTGYDDDIIQRIEAGNVFLQTPSELIRGGQRLFGLRTDLRFGALSLTAVASQQDAEGSVLSIEGGTQTTPFALAPSQYEDNTHFFLAYHFRNHWDRAHENATTPTPSPGFNRIIAVEVWKHDASVNQQGGTSGGNTANEIVQATALLDLAEPGPGNTVPGAPERGVLDGADAYLAAFGPVAPLPDTLLDQYDAAELAALRDSASTVNLEQAFDLREGDYESARFRRLAEGRDYDFDPFLGRLSLRQALTENEMIGVAYQYADNDGDVMTVGDFGRGSQSGSTNGDRIVLKLMRGNNPVPANASWGLTMRNIYRVGGRGLTPSDFDVQVLYEPTSQTPQRTLPNVSFEQRTLLQVLGLDRLNDDGLPQPDDAFDFRDGYTIDRDNGRIIFPVREPFGDYLRRALDTGAVLGDSVAVTFSGTTEAEAIRRFAFDTLYSLKPDVAARLFPSLRNYQIAGQYRSAVQSTYELGFAIVENTVRVTSGQVPLNEGTDYTVNYASGTIQIINERYLTPGQNLRIEYERNQFLSLGSKTLLGLRADYAIGPRAGLGATFMRLSEKPLIDKYRIGEEPLSNAIFGLDGHLDADPRWMTRVLDALPLIQTRAPSHVELRGEFAQLLPGHPETFAFEQERDDLREIGRDFQPDEIDGLSFVDDFEGIENVLQLTQPGSWRLTAAPDGAGPDSLAWTPAIPITDPRLPTNWRGLFTWYTLQPSLYNAGGVVEQAGGVTAATLPIEVTDLFPNRQVPQGQSNLLTPLDLYFDPTRRGPYNYNRDLATAFANNPRDAWGGMVQRLPEGYTDFTARNNIEFIEFIFTPLGGRNGNEPVSPEGTLYLDLGSISEDILPNRLFNGEDGLLEQPLEPGSADAWGRYPTGQASNTVETDDETGRTEDLGLDGLPSRRANPSGAPYVAAEDSVFAPFVSALPAGSRAHYMATEDPSGDDYHYFEEQAFFSDPQRFDDGRATVQERFSQFFPGHEGNALDAAQDRPEDARANSRYPDSEDLNGNANIDLADTYFRYAIPLDPAAIPNSPYFQDEIVTEEGQTWYLMRVPVRSDAREAIGGIQDFSLIEAFRIWTTGHDRPATIRFGTLELVGSQWLKSERVGIDEDEETDSPDPDAATLFIETVNNEENRTTYAVPIGAVVSRTRDIGGGLRRNREQALVFRVEGLPEGEQRAIYKPFTTNRLDLTKYSNLRLFVHGEGFRREDSVRVFVRLGANETTDYYEYEQPVYPFEPTGEGEPDPDSLWQTHVQVGGQVLDLNSVNVVLPALNRLKVERDDNDTVSVERRYAGTIPPEGAPPGARLFIRGTPSLQTVSTIVIGIRNAGRTGPSLDDAEVWVNELRVTGYDEASGWSAYGRAAVRLADVADVNARFSRQTDGFGELGSGLGDRSFNDRQDLSLIANFNAHKLVPERFGLSVPVSLSMTQTTSVPRFSPRRGDIRVEELIQQAEEDPALTPEQRRERVDAIRAESETNSFQRTFRIPFSMSGHRSPWLRYTIEGLQLAYTNSATRQRSPSRQLDELDRWSGTATYRLQVPRPRTVRPFWFVSDVPVLGVLGRLRLNYLPQSFRVSADLDRSMGRNQDRPLTLGRLDTALVDVPEEFLFPIRQDHAFNHGRSLDFQYNPFTFLVLGYRSNVDQSLSTAGADEAFALFVRDTLNGNVIVRTYDISRAEAFAPGGPARTDFGIPEDIDTAAELAIYLDTANVQLFENRRLRVLPFGEVLSGLFSGERTPLTNTYDQDLSGTFRPALDRIRALSWLRLQDVTYTTRFSWRYQPLPQFPDETVASVSAQASVRGGITLRPRDLWRKLAFYRRLEASVAARPGVNRPPPGRPGAPQAAPPTAPPADSVAQEAAPRRRLPRLGDVGRRLFLALTGMEDLTVTYNGAATNGAAGLEGAHYSLLDALRGRGPSLAYRLGLDRRIPFEDRFATDLLQYQDNLAESHRFNGRSSLRISPNLTVNLTTDLSWQENDTFGFTVEEGGLFEQTSSNRRGDNQATVLLLGGSYLEFLERHRQRFARDVFEGTPDENGRFASDVLTRNGVAEDFRAVFARSAGGFGPAGGFRLPLPNWEVNWSGLSNLPFLRRLTQQVTLRHGYSATYQTDYASNAQVGTTTTRTFTVLVGDLQTPRTLISTTPELETGTIRVNERFQPLLGANVSWRGGIQTDFTWNKSNIYSLATASASLSQGNTEELSARLNYSRTGIRLPFLRRGRINNNVRFSLSATRTRSQDAVFALRQDLERVLRGQAPNEARFTGQTRLTVEPRLTYALSNQVSLDAFVRYEQLESRGSQVPSSSKLDGGFNIRVSFSN
ncbi:MAG TPA: cell surface protein SprA [Rubricoccaceae bacterium]|nr:cell surface protein SprA [Rubricoccaceae bacterium]